MIRAFLPAMLAEGGGSIINMASVVSTLKAAPDRCAYHASKAAVIGLTKSVAFDYAGPRRPAATRSAPARSTPLPSTSGSTPTPSPRLRARPSSRATRSRRIGSPSEIAALCVYLGSDESAFTTGQALVIDGAWSL